MVLLGQPEHTKTLEATQLLNMVDTQTCTRQSTCSKVKKRARPCPPPVSNLLGALPCDPESHLQPGFHANLD